MKPNCLSDIPVIACEIDAQGSFIWVNNFFKNTFLTGITGEVTSIFNLVPSNIISSKSLETNNKFSVKTTVYDSGGRPQSFLFHFTPSIVNNSYTVVVTDLSELEHEKKINSLMLRLANAEMMSSDLNTFYKTLQIELNGVFDTSNLFIVLWDKLQHQLKLTYFNDEKDTFSKFPQGKTLSCYVIENGKSLLVTKSEIIHMQSMGLIEIVGTLPEVWLGIPLKINDDTLGLLAVQSYRSEQAYTAEDVQVLEFVSSQIAMSIERKHYEDSLKLAMKRAEEADALKSSFLANMSHEIRTPMNSIVGFSELITRKSIPVEKKELYAQYISSSGKSLIALIDDIIDISKIDANQLNIVKSSTPVNQIMLELYETFLNQAAQMNKSEVKLVKHCAVSDDNFSILCDSVRFRQIFGNLLGNALKFTETGFVEFGYIIPNNATILFYVKDSGIGIEKEKIDCIFDRFRQADNSATRKYGGTGLGLAISKKLVQLMGGRIWVESEPNKGATFCFSLPMIIPSSSDGIIKSSKKKWPSHNLQGVTILIAEDDDSNFYFLQEVISPTSATVIRAYNGNDAVEKVLQNPNISIVLMDIQMPVMNGYEATKKIKLEKPDLPVIAQTAFAMAEDRAKSIRAGCDEYLSKPIKPEQLIEVLKKFIP
ncbi:MAG TPA: ATP-binding protein [Tenuifilaceae bacterium]|nr:ATP-binding protein [Tenuifilaceae bacterium]